MLQPLLFYFEHIKTPTPVSSHLGKLWQTENFWRLQTEAGCLAEREGWHRENKERTSETWTQSEAQVTTKCRGWSWTERSSAAQRHKETKSSPHCSSSAGRTIGRQAGLRSLNLFDTEELHGIFLFQLPNYLPATQWNMSALFSAITFLLKKQNVTLWFNI